jgi:hypothetical protein
MRYGTLWCYRNAASKRITFPKNLLKRWLTQCSRCGTHLLQWWHWPCLWQCPRWLELLATQEVKPIE